MMMNRWVKAANNHHNMHLSKLKSADDMETDWMERKSVEMSDMVWAPSADIITWLKSQGWGIPQATFLMPYLPGREVSQVLSFFLFKFFYLLCATPSICYTCFYFLCVETNVSCS